MMDIVQLERRLSNTNSNDIEFETLSQQLQEVHRETCRDFRLRGKLADSQSRAEEVVRLAMELEQARPNQQHRLQLADSYFTLGNIMRCRLKEQQETQFVKIETYLLQAMEIYREFLLVELKTNLLENATSFTEVESVLFYRNRVGRCLTSLAILQHYHGNENPEELEKEALNLFASLPVNTASETWFFDSTSNTWHVNMKPPTKQRTSLHKTKIETSKTNWLSKFSFKFSKNRKSIDDTQRTSPRLDLRKGKTMDSELVVNGNMNTSQASVEKLEKVYNHAWRLTALSHPEVKPIEDLPAVIYLHSTLQKHNIVGKKNLSASKQSEWIAKSQTHFVQLKNSPLVAKKHAEICFSDKWNSWTVRDISDGGVLVNGVRIKFSKVREGDVIVFGGCHHVKAGDAFYNGNYLDLSPFVFKLERVFDISTSEIVPPGLFLDSGVSDFPFRHFHAQVMTDYLRKQSMKGNLDSCIIGISNEDIHLLYRRLEAQRIPVHMWQSWIQTHVNL